MLHNVKTLRGYTLHSLDGDIGTVKEFYFDDKHWTIRYLIADTGNWLKDRLVLLSPYALTAVHTGAHNIAIELSKQQIEESPPLSSDKPVSRQFEESYHKYYGIPTYWGGSFVWGAYPYIERDRKKWRETTQSTETWDPNLRSTYDVIDYHIQAADGEIGHVKDFIIDDETWVIRYLIIDTRNWWPGKKVLFSPQWIERVSWNEAKVFVNLPRKTIKQSPEYTGESLFNREYETSLYAHYQRQGYWIVPDGKAHHDE